MTCCNNSSVRLATLCFYINYKTKQLSGKWIPGFNAFIKQDRNCDNWRGNQLTSSLNLEYPQGSGLGCSSLFLYYILNIPVGLYSTIRLFAEEQISCMVIKLPIGATRSRQTFNIGRKLENGYPVIQTNVMSDQIYLHPPWSSTRVTWRCQIYWFKYQTRFKIEKLSK